MFQRLLALASVTAVACLGLAFTTGGCSSSDPAGPSTSGAGGSPEAGPRPPPPEDDDPPKEKCGPKGGYATMEAYDAEYGWQPPPARQNACTADDIEAIKNVTQLSTLHDLVAGTSDACKACVLSTKDSSTWGPFVITNEDATAGITNYGACYAAVDTPECGKAKQYLELCVHKLCAGCTEASELQSCASDAMLKQCETMVAEMQAQCTKLAEAESHCSSIVSGIEYLCAHEGADAGAPDGGS